MWALGGQCGPLMAGGLAGGLGACWHLMRCPGALAASCRRACASGSPLGVPPPGAGPWFLAFCAVGAWAVVWLGVGSWWFRAGQLWGRASCVSVRLPVTSSKTFSVEGHTLPRGPCGVRRHAGGAHRGGAPGRLSPLPSLFFAVLSPAGCAAASHSTSAGPSWYRRRSFRVAPPASVWLFAAAVRPFWGLSGAPWCLRTCSRRRRAARCHGSRARCPADAAPPHQCASAAHAQHQWRPAVPPQPHPPGSG